MLGDLFVAAKCVLLIVVVFVSLFWPHEVLIDRGEFDVISDRYLTVMSRYRGLKEGVREDLKQELESEGFENISITAPKTAEWGDEVTLTIIVDKTYDKLVGLEYEEDTLEMKYRNSTIISGLEGS